MSQKEIQEVRELIQSSGLRATSARVATLRILRKASAPLSHAEVSAELAKSGVDRATAFRNLNDMADAGILRRTELGDHVYRFEEIRADEKSHGRHPHFLCTVCGVVKCLTSVELTADSQRASEEVGEVVEILLRGRCKECD